MAVHNLPPFADEPTGRDEPGAPPRRPVTFADADVVGRWIKARGSLSELGAALRVGEDASVDDVKSAPDPWAQVRVFADAIVRDNHPLHARATAQWRALLALFALEKDYENVYALDLRPVSLKGGSRFERVMTTLPPHERLPQGDRPTNPGQPPTAEWDRPVLVSLRTVESRIGGGPPRYAAPVLIGMLNPACLVAPGRRTSQLKFANIPWMREGFRDPLSLQGGEALPAIKLAALHAYVLNLRSELETLAAGRLSELLRGMRHALDLFAKDCEAAGAADARIPVSVRSADQDATLPPLYGLLRSVVKAEEPGDPASTSECLIRLRPDLGERAPFKGVVLIDQAIAVTLGRHASNVLAWGSKSLADLASPSQLEATRAAAAAHGYYLATPDELLSPVFLRLGSAAVIQAHPEGFKDAPLPVSPLALLLAGPAGLGSMLKVGGEAGVRQRVTLTVSLEPPGGADRRGSAAAHGVIRTYATSPGEGEGRLVGDAVWAYGQAAFWPNFTHADWRWNVARLANSKRIPNGATGRFAISARALADLLAPLGETERFREFAEWCSPDAFTAEPLAPLAGRLLTEPWLSRVRSRDGETDSLEVFLSPYAFEAIGITSAEDSTGPARPAGLVLNSLPTANTGARSETVAIDFGTTNTVACFRDGAPIAFKDRVVFPIASADSGFTKRGMTAQAWNLIDFLPPRLTPTPTPSVMMDRDVDDAMTWRELQRTADDAALLPDVIYFMPPTGAVAGSEQFERGHLESVISRSHLNLKWSDEAADRIAAQHFLRQFMLMAAAEAVDSGSSLANLKWSFSRPDSMDDHVQFETAMRRRLAEIAPGASDALLPLCSEGLSTANFILSGAEDDRRAGGQFFRPAPVNLILDIGGGTTDVAIWVNNQPVWSGSYRLAGGHFFTDHIVHNPALLESFGLEGWAALLNAGRGEQRPVGELLFSHTTLNEALDKGWTNLSGGEDVKALVRTAFTFLGGMAWYLGLVVRGLVDREVIDAQHLNSVAFALCGRGSGIFSRLHGPRAQADTPVSRLLTLFQTAAGATAGVQPSVFVSTKPKLEVVRGMIVPPERSAVRNLHSVRDAGHSYEPAGLDTPFGGQLLATGANYHDAPAGAPGRPNLASFYAFLDQLYEAGRFRLDIDQGGDQSVAADIQQVVLTALQDELKEPPFVTALRVLIGNLAASDRAERLGVTDAPPAGKR